MTLSLEVLGLQQGATQGKKWATCKPTVTCLGVNVSEPCTLNARNTIHEECIRLRSPMCGMLVVCQSVALQLSAQPFRYTMKLVLKYNPPHGDAWHVRCHCCIRSRGKPGMHNVPSPCACTFWSQQIP